MKVEIYFETQLIRKIDCDFIRNEDNQTQLYKNKKDTCKHFLIAVIPSNFLVVCIVDKTETL